MSSSTDEKIKRTWKTRNSRCSLRRDILSEQESENFESELPAVQIWALLLTMPSLASLLGLTKMFLTCRFILRICKKYKYLFKFTMAWMKIIPQYYSSCLLGNHLSTNLASQVDQYKERRCI